MRRDRHTSCYYILLNVNEQKETGIHSYWEGFLLTLGRVKIKGHQYVVPLIIPDLQHYRAGRRKLNIKTVTTAKTRIPATINAIKPPFTEDFDVLSPSTMKST